jgi:hypothetical protein
MTFLLKRRDGRDIAKKTVLSRSKRDVWLAYTELTNDQKSANCSV